MVQTAWIRRRRSIHEDHAIGEQNSKIDQDGLQVLLDALLCVKTREIVIHVLAGAILRKDEK